MTNYPYHGVKEELEKIKAFRATSKRADADYLAYNRLKAVERTISSLLMDDEGNTYLLTYRRETRQLLEEYM